MWTEEDIQALRAKLVQTLDDELHQGNYTCVGQISVALGLLQSRGEHVNLDELVSQVEKLVGSDWVHQALDTVPETHVAPPESPTPEQKPEDLPLPPTGVPSSEAPTASVEPPSTAQPTQPPVGSFIPEDPALQARLQPLLDDLRTVRRQAPEKAQELPGYIGRLEGVVQEIMATSPQSREALQAAQDAALLHEMQALADQLQRVRRKAEDAKASLDLQKARDARHDADESLKKSRDVRYSKAFHGLAHDLHQTAEILAGDNGVAEVYRKEIASSLSTWLSQQYTSLREVLVAQLDTLSEYVRLGVPEVPVDVADESAAAKSPQSLYNERRAELLNLCVTKAESLLSEPLQRLDKDLQTARERCQEALKFVQTKHISNIKDAQDVQSKIQSTLQDIEKLDKSRRRHSHQRRR